MPKTSLFSLLLTASLFLWPLTKAIAQDPPHAWGPMISYMKPENIIIFDDNEGYQSVVGGSVGDILLNTANADINGGSIGSYAYRPIVSTSTTPTQVASEGKFKVVWHWAGPPGYPVYANIPIANSSEAEVTVSQGVSSGAHGSTSSIIGITSAACDTFGHSANPTVYTHYQPSQSPYPRETVTSDNQVTCKYTIIHTVSSLEGPGFETSCHAYIHWQYVSF